MNYQEWQRITGIMLKFYNLSQVQQDTILLLIDGLMFRDKRGKK